MFKIDDIKHKFKESLLSTFSINEILSMWNLWVLKYVFKISQIDYLNNSDLIVSEEERQQVHCLVKHLLCNKPIQYFFGFTYFKSLKIHVNSDVLIPRPETEQLIDIFFSKSNYNSSHQIIDIGTGSGCISIAIKKYIQSQIYAIDICNDALEIANQNAVMNNVEVDFQNINILNQHDHNFLPKIDAIISNPPYVMRAEVPKNSIIYSEPSQAIFVPCDNPLIFYNAICQFANSNLKTGGKIFFEINPKLIEDLIKLINRYGYFNIEIHKDFYEKKRFIVVYS